MSFWFYGKDREGRRTLTSISVSFMHILVFLALFISLFFALMLSGGLRDRAVKFTALIIIGFTSFVVSKYPQFSRGEQFAWGTRHMGAGSKILYFLGYAIMIIGVMGFIAIYKGTP